MIVGLHHVSISVSDLDRALDFYRDVLGFEEVQRSVFSGDAPLSSRSGSTTIRPQKTAGRALVIMVTRISRCRFGEWRRSINGWLRRA
jgi:catechol 2,3-dioxygenase-like lactoylglutathione lyase family enzyme